jgi:hypothetical protein
LPPLEVAGHHTIESIEDARSKALPGDPDITAEQSAKLYFFRWVQAMQQADPANAAQPFNGSSSRSRKKLPRARQAEAM